MCKPHLFWGVSDRNLAFSKPLSPWVVAITLDWNAFLSRGGTEVHTCVFCCRCFLKPPSLGDVQLVLPLSSPKFHVFMSQIVSPRWHSSSGACSGLPATPSVPVGRKCDPMQNEANFLPWALNYWNCKQFALFMENRPFLRVPSASSSGEASTAWATLLAGILTNMHHNEKAAPSSSWTERIQTSPFQRKQVIHLSCWEERLTYVEHIVPSLVKL